MSSFNDFTLNEYIAVTAFAVIIGTALSYTPIPGNPSIPSETVPSWSAHAASRALVITTARLMNTTGINQGTSGNVSLRVTDGFLITPSGIPYDTMTPAQVTFFSLAATTGYYGPCKPSSEYRMHRDMYLQFPACNSIVHAHSTFATVLSAQRRAIPAFHYMVGVAGGKIIPCAELYVDGTFGSQALSDSITKALKADNVTACLLANHGAICYSTGSLPKALSLATEVETLAKQYVYATMGSTLPIILSDEEMKVILAKFKTYGKQNGELACLCQFDQDHAIVAPPKLG